MASTLTGGYREGKNAQFFLPYEMAKLKTCAPEILELHGEAAEEPYRLVSPIVSTCVVHTDVFLLEHE